MSKNVAQERGINVQGHFLKAALNSGKRGVRCISFFYLVQMLFPNKRFSKAQIQKIAKACGYEPNEVYELIRECVKCGVMVRLNDNKHTIRLISNKELSIKFGGTEHTTCFVPLYILRRGLRATTIFVRNIPNLSCMDSQMKACEKKKNRLSKLNDARDSKPQMVLGTVKNGELVYTTEEHRLSRKFKPNGSFNNLPNATISLSNKKGAKVSGVSKPTFIKDKYYLETLGVWRVEPQYRTVQEGVSSDKWDSIKYELPKHGYVNHARYNRGAKSIFRDLPCKFILPKYA